MTEIVREGYDHIAGTFDEWRLVRTAGFAIEHDELVTFQEPEGEATFQWILARR